LYCCGCTAGECTGAERKGNEGQDPLQAAANPALLFMMQQEQENLML